MNILAIDDEKIMLNELVFELNKVFPGECIHAVRTPELALEWVHALREKNEVLDYAFMDIHMSGMNGLELAGRIKKIFSKTVLIFCTAYSEYAFDAMGMYAKGYLMKPISAEDVTRTLDEMVYDWRGSLGSDNALVQIQTFGHFECFVDKKPLFFEREKAKELLAYLVDRHGASITTEQISAVLWPEKNYNRTMKNYVGTIRSSLQKTLKEAGVEEILIKSRNHLAINVNKIRCDAYDFEKGDAIAVNSFNGEYMANYSWAEFTTGNYVRVKECNR